MVRQLKKYRYRGTRRNKKKQEGIERLYLYMFIICKGIF